MPTTAANLVNRALVEIGSQTLITSLTDGTPYANIALQVFDPFFNFLVRQADWDFTRAVVGPSLTGNTAPFPWTVEYVYPSTASRIRYLTPGAVANPFDPQPVRFAVGTVLEAEPTKVIWADIVVGQIIYSLAVVEEIQLDYTDPMFQEALVRMLASAFSMANAGRPDYSRIMLEWASQFEQLGEGRPY
jgi:hypothetical protein